jgi:hypothetical protein
MKSCFLIKTSSIVTGNLARKFCKNYSEVVSIYQLCGGNHLNFGNFLDLKMQFCPNGTGCQSTLGNVNITTGFVIPEFIAIEVLLLAK